MANAVATVASLEGQAWAKSPDGKLRPLKVGDAVTAEEVVITAQGAHIELDFGDGHPVSIAGGQEVLMNRDLWTDLASDNKDAAVDNASVQEALTVLNNGGDLTTNLEETAAGLSGGSANEGHSFVELTRVVEDTDPNAFNFAIANGDGGAVATFNSTPIANNAPIVTDQGFTGNEDAVISGRVIANDVENDVLTYGLVGQPANGTITLDPTTGNFVYTPNGNYNGPDSFVVTVTDDHGNVTTSTINLTVNSINDAPVSSNQNLTTPEDTPVSGQVVATDVEGDTLTYNVSTSAAHGTVTINAATGSFVYTPGTNYNGSDSFVVTVNDGNGGTTTSTITIGVTPVNDGPVSSNQNLTTPEDTPITGSVVATDVDGDTLAYSVTSSAANGTVTLNAATGAFVYTPGANFNGSDSFVVTVNDGNGGSTTSTITIGVTPVNDGPVSSNQNLTTLEDTPVAGSVVAIDVDGDTLAYSVSSSATHGTVTLNAATGAFVYTPGANYNGSDSFIVTVSDGNGGTTTSTITIGVTPVNDGPVSSNQNLTTPEDIPIAGSVVATDVDGDTLAYSVTSSATHGTVTLNATTGAFVYTPGANYNGSDSFVVTVNDGNGGTTTSTITIGVTPVNDGPVSSNQTLTTPEDTPVAGSVVATDADGDVLSYAVTSNAANGSVTINATTGGFVYTPNSNYNGSDSFTVSVSDGNGGVTTSVVNIGVTPVNDAPVSTGQNLTTPEDTPVSGQVVATDVDGDVLTYSVTSNAANGSVTINAVTGGFVYTPNSNYNGSDSFTVTVNDGNGGVTTSVINIGVTPVNDAPTSGNQTLSTPESTPLNGAISANDPDGDPLTYSVTGTASHGSVALNPATGGFVYTPTAGYTGGDSFTISINDGHGGITTSTVNIGVQPLAPVNAAPTANNDSATTNESTAVTVAVRANDTDPDGDTLTVSGVTQGTNGSVVIDAVTGNPIYTPNAGYIGGDSFTYSISDGNGHTSTATVNVTVNAVVPANNAPVSVADNINVAEGGTATILTGGATSVLTNDTDADGDPLTAVLVTGPAHGTLTLNANGTFSYTHDGSETTTDSFTYKANDGTVSGNLVTVNIGVSPVNDAPVNSVPASQSLNEDGALVFNSGNGNLISVNDVDAGSSSIQVTLTATHGAIDLSGTTGLSFAVGSGTGDVTMTFTGTQADINNALNGLTYTPVAGYNGSAALQITTNDLGNTGAGGAKTDTDSIALTVNPAANHAPVAVADNITVAEGGVVTTLAGGATSVLANDTDSDGNPLTAILVSGPTNGTLTLNANGTFSYVHNGSETTTDSFTYKVNDGTVDGNTVTVNIGVTPVNDAPVAIADNITVAEGGTANVLVGGATSVLANDTDAENDPLSAILVTGPTHGTLTLNANGTFSYTHDGSETTGDSFTYKVNDGTVDGNTVTVNIGVTPVDDPSVLVADTKTVVENTTATGNVLTNDSDVDSVLTVASFEVSGVVGTFTAGQTANLSGVGSFTLDANGGYTFIPDTGWSGAVPQVTYTTNTGSNSTLDITVTHTNVAPETFAVTVSGNEDTVIAVTLSGSDSDGTVAGYVINSLPANGVLYSDALLSHTITAGDLVMGSVYFKPADNWNGSTNFNYSAQDNLGLNDASPATVNITVDPVVDVTTVSLTASNNVVEGGSITYTATLTDPAVSPVIVNLSNGSTISIAAGATVGSVSFAAPTDNVYLDAGSVSVTISGATGGGFESLAIDGTAAVTAVADSIDTTTISLTGATAITEGNVGTYTLSLTNPAQTAVTVTLNYSGVAANGTDISGSTTVTIPAGTSLTNFSIAALTDGLVEGNESFTVSIASATGGNFENLAISGVANSVTTNVVDVDFATVSLTATPSLTEAGGTLVYTATINHAPLSDLTVTLSNGSTVTILAGQTSGTASVSVAGSDDVYIDPSDITATIASTSGGGINVVINPAAAVTHITDTIDTTTVSLSATGAVAEGGTIVYTATLTNPAHAAVTVNLSNGSVITIANGATTGTVSVAAPADDAHIDAGSVSATITTATGGNFEQLTINPTAAVTTVTDTIDTTTLSLSAAGSVAEGGSIVYTATLTNPADGAVTVNLSNGSVITIANGATTGTVSVAAPTDDVYVDAGTVSATITGATGGNFENLVINNATPTTTTITDTIDTTTLSLTGAASITEGSSGTYTLSLTHPAQTAVTVTLNYSGVAANGTDITGQTTVTIPANASSANFSIAALTDGLVEGTETFTVSIGSATGGNFENLAVSGVANSVTTNVLDANTATVSLSATPTLTEAGGTLVYTATISSAPVSNLVVTLSNGQTITILAGQTSGTNSTIVANSDDVYIDPSNISATITGVSGGGINVAINPTAAVTAITDTIDTTTVTLSSAANANEGGSVVYTATVGNPVTNTPLVIHLSNGVDITIPVGSTTANSTAVPMRADDAYIQGNQSVTVGISSTSGGNYEALNTTSTTTTVVHDNASVTTVSLSAAANVNEGGSIVYTATVGSAVTGTSLVIHLSNGTDITIPVGATSANSSAVAVRADDAYVQGNQSVIVGISGTSGGNYEALNTTSTTTTVVSDNGSATTVTLSAAASVNEGGSIFYTATVDSAVTGTPLVIHLSNGTDITIPVGATSANSSAVSVRADDAYVQGNQFVTVGISSTSGGNYEALNTTSTTTTVVHDNGSVTTVSLSAAANVNEGGSIVYTATIGNAVTGTPLVIHLSNGTDITIPVGSTSANSSAVTVRADDAYVQGNQSVTVGISSTSGGNYEALNTSSTAITVVSDNGSATSVTLSAAASVNEGGSIFYTATVDSAVTGTPLVIHLSNGTDITIPVGATSANSSAVSVRADDAYVQGNQLVTVGISSTSGGNYEALNTTSTTTTIVSDNGSVTTVSLSAAANVVEGGSVVYTATVGSAVTGSPLVIHLNNGSDITIPVGATSANSAAVAVRADDAYVQGNQSVVVGISGTSGGNYEALNTSSTATTVVSDNGSATTVTLTAAANVNEGGSIVYTATVNNAVTDTPLVIHLNNGTDITIPVGSTSANSAAVPVRADDAYIQGNQTLTVGISSTSGGNYEALTTTSTVSTIVKDDADVTTVTLTATNTVVEGGNIIYTATLSNPAHGAVIVNLSNGSVITIADNATTGTVSVATHADNVYADAVTVSATIISATGGNFEVLTPNPTAATTSVTDTIDATTLSISGVASIREGSSGAYTLTLDHPTLTALTVTLVYSGVAGNGTDINGQTTVTIPAGSSTANFSIAALTDALTEGNENFTVAIGSTTGGSFESLVVNSTANSVTTTVIDNRAPVAVNDPAVDSVTSKGLFSEYYSYFEGPDGANVTNLAQINTFISSRGPDATFIATKFDYGTATAISTNLGYGTNLQTFLGSDAASLSNDPDTSSDAIIRMYGSVELAAGTYNFKVLADDGYQIKIDGAVVAQVNAIQSPTGTVHSQFTVATGGQHSIEILYWDQGGQAVFKAELSNNNGVSYNLLSSVPTTHTGVHTMNEDTQWSVTTAELLANDTDADGDTLSVIGVQGATHGTVQLSGSNVIYTPDANYNGAASYTYTISDGHGGTSTATVAIDVVALNDNPIANTDTYITSTGTAVTFKTTALIANDTDVDGNAIIFGSLSNSTNGTTSISGSDITFTPTAGFNGIATVNYSISDGHNGSATGLVNIEVANVIGTSGNNTLVGNLTTSNTIAGLAGNDKLTGNTGNDLLDGGSGNDTMTGGAGADTFVWHLGDKGTTAAPASDTITDFTTGAGGDKLDLRDLLQNENSTNLTNYLHFTSDGVSTTVSISSAGAFTGSNYATAADQTILLTNVNLTGGDTAIINLLKTNNNLITD